MNAWQCKMHIWAAANRCSASCCLVQLQLQPCSASVSQKSLRPASELRSALQDIIKDGGHPYFMAVLRAPLNDGTAGGEVLTLATHAECVFILTMLCDGFPTGQARCHEAGFLEALMDTVREQARAVLAAQGAAALQPGSAWKALIYSNLLLLAWALLGLGKLCEGQPAYVAQAVVQHSAVDVLRVRRQDVVG